MRKWSSYSNVPSPPVLEPVEGEKIKRARVFGRWITNLAEPGGLRALAGEQTRDEQARHEWSSIDGPR